RRRRARRRAVRRQDRLSQPDGRDRAGVVLPRARERAAAPLAHRDDSCVGIADAPLRRRGLCGARAVLGARTRPSESWKGGPMSELKPAAQLAEEIELRRQIERVAALRRALPPGGEARDYRFKDESAKAVGLADLFG